VTPAGNPFEGGDMADELDKNSVGATDEGDDDVEAHKNAIGKNSVGKTSVGESDDENDVEAHKYTVGKTSVGKTSIG
jgi:hypothetical protein